MAPRALGALLACVAAIAFVVSIASSAWWSGHPSVEGRTIAAKHVSVGLVGASGCNTGGDGTCEPLDIGATTSLIGAMELAGLGLATLLLLVLAMSAWKIGDHRKGLAKATTIVTLAVTAVGIVLLAIGPDIKATQQIGVPIGWGTYLFFVGVASSLGAAAITRKLEPEPLRLKPGVPGLAPPPPDPMAGYAPAGYANGYAPPPPWQAPSPGYDPGYQQQGYGYAPPTDAGYVNPSYPNPGYPPAPMPPPYVAPAATLPGPGEPLGPPVDPFARTEPRPAHGGGDVGAPLAPPASRPRSPSMAPLPDGRTRTPTGIPAPRRPATASSPPPPRAHSQSAAPPPRPQSPSVAPPPRPHSPSTAPPLRALSPSTAPPLRAHSSSVAPPPRPQSPSTAPPLRPLSPSTAPPLRAQSSSVAPPPRPHSPSTAPPLRPHSPSTPPPRAHSQSAAPPPRPQSPSVAPGASPRAAKPSVPPPRAANPSVAPPSRGPAMGPIPTSAKPAPRARTVAGPGTDPSAKPFTPTPRVPPPLQPGEPELRPSAPTLAHAVPPIPDNLPPPSVLSARSSSTAIEVDAAAKAKAHAQAAKAQAQAAQSQAQGVESTARGTLDPRLASRGSKTDLSATIGESTSTATGVDAALAEDDEAGTSVGPVPINGDEIDDGSEATSVTTAPAPPTQTPSSSQRIITGEARALSTSQRSVARAPTEDPFDTNRGLELSPPDGPLAAEPALHRVTELGMVAEDGGPVTDVHDIPDVGALMGDVPTGTLSTELAAASGSIGDEHDAADDDGHDHDDSEAMPSLSSVSTAPSSLPPPKATQVSTSGPTPGCPQCDSPMDWVDEHLRFYCKQCRMYF